MPANSTAANIAVTHAAAIISTHGILASIASRNAIPLGFPWAKTVTTITIEEITAAQPSVIFNTYQYMGKNAGPIKYL